MNEYIRRFLEAHQGRWVMLGFHGVTVMGGMLCRVLAANSSGCEVEDCEGARHAITATIIAVASEVTPEVEAELHERWVASKTRRVEAEGVRH